MKDTASLDAHLDTAAKSAQFIGDVAKTAMTVGEIALPLIELLVVWVPGLGPFAADLAIALPYIQKVATYAPAVKTAVQQGKPMIEATVEIGAALLEPLHALIERFPKLVDVSPFFAGVQKFLHSNEFTPQDPRFDRAQGIPQ